MKLDRELKFVPAVLKKLQLQATAQDDQDFVLVIFQANPSAKVDQDITLVAAQRTATAKVDQDVILVAYSRPVGNATQLMTWDEPDLQYIIKKRRNEGLYIQASVPVFQTTTAFFPVVFVVT